MTNEYLPIKFFAKRDVDDLRVEAGGSKKPPKFQLEGEELGQKSRQLIQEVSMYKEKIKHKEEIDSLVPVVIRAKIIDDASSKTHRKKVTELFRPTGSSNNIIGLAESNELIIELDNLIDTNKIIAKLGDTVRYAHALSCIDTIIEFAATITYNEDDLASDYKIKLLNFQNYEHNRAIHNNFELTLNNYGFKFRKTNYSTNHVIYNLRSVNSTAIELLQTDELFESIFSIEPMPVYSISLDVLNEDSPIEISTPDENVNYTAVGILDSGIAKIPHLAPWLLNDNYSAYPETVMNNSHGTFVSGIVAYGDQLENKLWTGTAGFKLLDACVIPDTRLEGVNEDELVNNIRSAVRLYHENVKVWNLSISRKQEVDKLNFSDFAVALDDIQDEYNVLICKSAGNCTNFLSRRPKGKIHQGADSIRSLVVGSLAHAKSSADQVEIDNPSPFSRIGRGPSYVIKPEVSHYGGNAGVSEIGRLVKSGVKSFSPDGSISSDVGTSFSTPRIASIAAGLQQEIDDEFDPLLIKSLIVHSATYSENLQIPEKERVNQLGFGKPHVVREILHNSPHEVTLILRDELSKGQFIDIMDFPMPDSLAENGFFEGQIIATLVYDPILDPSQRSEYCQSNIDILFGTYNEKTDRDTERKTILNPIGREGSQNLLLESCYSKTKLKKNDTDFALKERMLIKYGDKFYPVKKYAVDLSEMKKSKQLKHLGSDKNWYLKITGLFREHLEKMAQFHEDIPSQDFCLILTIRDPSETKPVYDEVTQKLIEHNFWHSNIKLHSEVQTHVTQ
jgi:hypothetical protein